MTDFQFFMPIAKVDKETRTVSGYASTPTKDGDGEIVTLDAIKGALPGYMEYGNIREMHALKAVGVAEEANIDTKGLFLTARIVDDAAWAKCVEGVYKGFSIGGKKLAKTGNKITGIEMTEISIVDRPSNPDARFALAKSQKTIGEAAGFLLKVKATRTPEQKALAKMAKVVEGLAKAGNPPAAHDGFSLPAKVVAKVEDAEKCKTHGAVECGKCAAFKAAGTAPCKEHDVFECDKCSKAAKAAADELAKREFDTKQREDAADSGAALLDGSFPIKNVGDLKNAIQAFGRAKDKGKAKAHIVARAKALGVTGTLPDGWTKDKEAKKLAKARMGVLLGQSSEPSFLTLGKAATIDDATQQFMLEKFKYDTLADELTDAPLAKGMNVAGSLAYTFDSIREAQRRLLSEGKREGGDGKDKALAKQLGEIAKTLAGIISQKATHEGEEAITLTDADDNYLTTLLGEDYMMDKVNADGTLIKTGDPIVDAVNAMFKRAATPSRAQRMAMADDNMDKSRKAAKMARKAVEDVHKMLKASYIAKAAKKDKKDDDEDDFDSAEAMGKLQKAYQEIDKARMFGKAAREQIAKASGRSGQRGQEVGDGTEDYIVPAGVKDLSPGALASAGPAGGASGSAPPEYPVTGGVYPGKAANGGDLAKYIGKDGTIPAGVVELLMEKAQSAGELEALRRVPMSSVNGRRPMSFDLTKVLDNGGGGTNKAEMNKALFDGVDTTALSSGDEQRHTEASAKIIGNFLTKGHFAKSILDPSFRGLAGNGK